jgi:hypothetical protein
MYVNSDRAWVALLGAAFVYNVLADHRGWELLSVGAQRQRAAHPLIARLFIVATIGHLTGSLPRWADPYHWQYWRLLPKVG